MTGCRSEMAKLAKCERKSGDCEKERNFLHKCRTGFFFEARTSTTGSVYRPSPNVEINSNGYNVIFHETEHLIIGSQGIEFKIGGFKL